MSVGARFVHVNLVARDWERLARFYEQVFGCTPVPPERDLAGRWLDDATAIPGARIRGIHLRLPGCGDAGPTLEIFGYEPAAEAQRPVPNRPGFGHVAFAVDDVEAARDAVLFLVLSSGTARIRFFPCKTQPVVEDPPDYRSDWCGLWQFSPGFAGLLVHPTLGGLVVVALVLVVLPYLAGCALGRRLGR